MGIWVVYSVWRECAEFLWTFVCVSLGAHVDSFLLGIRSGRNVSSLLVSTQFLDLKIVCKPLDQVSDSQTRDCGLAPWSSEKCYKTWNLWVQSPDILIQYLGWSLGTMSEFTIPEWWMILMRCQLWESPDQRILKGISTLNMRYIYRVLSLSSKSFVWDLSGTSCTIVNFSVCLSLRHCLCSSWGQDLVYLVYLCVVWIWEGWVMQQVLSTCEWVNGNITKI